MYHYTTIYVILLWVIICICLSSFFRGNHPDVILYVKATIITYCIAFVWVEGRTEITVMRHE